MTQEVSSSAPCTVDLPPNAPRLRITAGSGSATQKTWNIRRPVTLIGSRRPAHIVLHDPSIAEAHCVIINTGTEFLLKDLHTQSGTTCNKVRIDLTILNDGDVINVGGMRIQVAVHAGDEKPSRVPADPTILSTPARVGLLDSSRDWTLRDAVTLIGKLQAAPIRLDAKEVSDRHAVLFRFGYEVGVFDLGGRDGVWVNGTHRPIAILTPGDRITIGSFGLQYGPRDQKNAHITDNNASNQSSTAENKKLTTPSPSAPLPRIASEESSENNGALDTGLSELKNEIASAWEKLNTWPTPLWDNKTELTTDTEQNEDKEDAAKRGELHDLQHLRDQLATKEQELSARARRLQAQEDDLEIRRRALDVRAAEVDERNEGVVRRERVVAQRWSRLLAATCSNCAQPFITGESRNSSMD